MDPLDELLLAAGVAEKETAHLAGPQRERAVVTDPTVDAFKEIHHDMNLLHYEIRQLMEMVRQLQPQISPLTMHEAQRQQSERLREMYNMNLYTLPIKDPEQHRRSILGGYST